MSVSHAAVCMGLLCDQDRRTAVYCMRAMACCSIEEEEQQSGKPLTIGTNVSTGVSASALVLQRSNQHLLGSRSDLGIDGSDL